MMKERGHVVQENSNLLKVSGMCILVAEWFKPCSEEQWKSIKARY